MTRTRILSLLALVLLVAALPAGASTPEPNAPCDVAEGRTNVSKAKPSSTTFASPIVPAPNDLESLGVPVAPPAALAERASARFDFRADLGGEVAKRGDFGVTLDWEAVGDYDLYIYDAKGDLVAESHAFNPLDGNGESATLTLDHCADFTVEVYNYLATPETAMSLSVTLNRLRA